MPKSITQGIPPRSKISSILLLVFLLVLAFATGFFKISSHDTFWHIKTGEYILHHGVPSADPFSFTAAGKHWVTHEWLAEIFFFIFYKIGGVSALIFFKGLMSALIAYLIFRFGAKRGISLSLSACVAMLTVGAMSYMLYARPHSFTFLFLALLGTLLFDDSGNERNFAIRRWVIIPVIFILWANIHAGFLLGLLIYWVVAVMEIFKARGEGLYKSIAKFGYPAILSGLICLINPSGYEIYYYPIMISANPVFKSSIAEWVSPIYLGRKEWLALGILGLLSLLGLIAALKHLRGRPDISLILIAGGVAAWTAMRNIQNYAVILAFGILALPVGMLSFRIFRRIKWLGAVAAIFWMITIFALVRNYQSVNGRTGMGIKAGLVPEGPAAFLKLIGFEGNILSALHDGGYLIFAGYPQWRVFIDGRLDVYGSEFLENYRRIIEGAPGALEALEQYGVDAAVLTMPPYIGAIRSQLSKSESWALIYYDDYYLVYFKPRELNRQILESQAFKIVNPLISGYGYSGNADMESFFEEAKRGLLNNANSSLAHLVYAYSLQLKGDFKSAAGSYKNALGLRPHRKDTYRNVATMYAQAGLNDSALAWYDRAIEVRPGDYQIFYEMGMLSARMNDFDNAERYFKQSLKINPGGPASGMLERLDAARTASQKQLKID